MAIALEPHCEGIVLPVRAHAGARRNEIRGEQDGMLKVSVTQAPEKGKANKALIAVLSEGLSLKKSQIELISGATSPQRSPRHWAAGSASSSTSLVRGFSSAGRRQRPLSSRRCGGLECLR